MTIRHRDGNKYKIDDGLSRRELKNDINNQAYDEDLKERDVPIMGIFISDLDETFWNEIKESYLTNKNTSTLLELLKSDHKNQGLIDILEDKWLQSYQKGRFELWEDFRAVNGYPPVDTRHPCPGVRVCGRVTVARVQV